MIDHLNFTGYAQTLIEQQYESDVQGGLRLAKRISYTFGSDEITQTTSLIDPSSQLITQSSTLTFGHDGHGSVRVLFEAAAAIAQVFTFSAYGELLSIHNAAGSNVTTQASPLTSMLYNGEGIDSRTGLYNFRARWYDTQNGRFADRLDPFAGNPHDPFSFNKYGAFHANPVMGTDPSGLSLIGNFGAITIGAVVANTAITVGQGIYNRQSASVIAGNVANNLAIFTLIYGTLFLSGPIAAAAGLLLVGVTVKGIYDVATNWNQMDYANRAFTVGQVLTFLVFAKASVARGSTGGSNTITDPTLVEAMRETGLTVEAVDHYFLILGEPQVFRGTTEGWPGNHPDFNMSPAAIDPAIATAFATTRATTNGGVGIIYYGGMKAFSDTISVGNYFSRLESEVGVPIRPVEFAQAAPHSVSAVQARSILQGMGRNVPDQIYGQNGLRTFLEQYESNRMTPEEIKHFIEQANQIGNQ